MRDASIHLSSNINTVTEIGTEAMWENLHSACFPLSGMVSDIQRIVAVWSILSLPFIVIGAYLWSQDELGIRFIVAYWFPAVVLTVVGVIPPPWQFITV